MRATLFALLAGLCWGIGEVFTKSVLHTHRVGPLTAIAVRSTVALPVLWAVVTLAWLWAARETAGSAAQHAAIREPTDWLSSGTPTLLRLILGSGLIAGAGGMVCFYLALSFGEVGKVKPIAFAIAPAVGALLGWLALGEAMTIRKALGIAVILAGVVLLAGAKPPQAS